MEGLWPSNMECVLLTSQTEVLVPFRDSLSSPFPVLPSKISSHLNPMEGLWPSDIGCVPMTSQTEVPVPFKDNLSSPLPPLPSHPSPLSPHPSPLTPMEGQIFRLFGGSLFVYFKCKNLEKEITEIRAKQNTLISFKPIANLSFRFMK